jgi:hypothetical protein
MIVEWQSLPVLHTADSPEIARADSEHATRTQRIWISWARVRCPGRSTGHSQENEQKKNPAKRLRELARISTYFHVPK